MEFSDKLKILRTEAGFTQNELADNLIISRQAVSNYEQGRGYPSIDILVAMSKLFGVSLDDLLSTGVHKKHTRNIMMLTYGLLACAMIANLLALYFLRAKNDLMTAHLTLMLCFQFVPALLFFAHLLFLGNPPKKANRIYGYRTRASMKSQLTWDYAQACAGSAFAYIAIALLFVNLAYGICAVWISLATLLPVAYVIFATQAASLLVPVVYVERKLRRFSNKSPHD